MKSGEKGRECNHEKEREREIENERKQIERKTERQEKEREREKRERKSRGAGREQGSGERADCRERKTGTHETRDPQQYDNTNDPLTAHDLQVCRCFSGHQDRLHKLARVEF